MITGKVQRDMGRIPLCVQGPRGRKRSIYAVIDTGYTGVLTLCASDVAELGLRFRSMSRATLPDGSKCLFAVFDGAKLSWDGTLRSVVVDQLEGDPLVGMRLMKGHELRIQVRPGGKLAIQPLPPRLRQPGA
jgi:predicted aspartyl protease